VAEQNYGRTGGYFTVGIVKNVEDDPTQTGLVKVQWQVGGGAQDQLGEDDLPWTRCMFPASNPSLGQTGGPHTGLRVGSVVYGVPIDGAGQEFMIVGSSPKSGDGDPDQDAQYDSDIPQPAKIQDVGGQDQPRYGDVNAIVTQESIVKYSEQEGGQYRSAALYASLDDSIGTRDDAITYEGGDNGGGGGNNSGAAA
jgi:hypothetical protein